MEELEHRMDQDTTAKNKQWKAKEEMPTTVPKDKIDGVGQTTDAGKDKG